VSLILLNIRVSVYLPFSFWWGGGGGRVQDECAQFKIEGLLRKVLHAVSITGMDLDPFNFKLNLF
jgi:hypothetical protein